MVALRRHHPRWSADLCALNALGALRQLPLTEQTLLGLFTLASTRRSAHARLNGSGARFAHTF